MLLELKVSQFAIIENLHISFKNGLNILSGETGAGKSVLLKSLSLLMGSKGSSESIRSGYQQASIEGSFDLSKRPDIVQKLQEHGIDTEENILVVRRTISEEKSRVYLNGTLSTLSTLRDMVSPLIEVAGANAPLIEMTGQHENRHLLSKSYHLDLMDSYCGLWPLRNQYSEKYKLLLNKNSDLEQFEKSLAQQSQRIDFLQYQKTELDKLTLKPGQEADLELEIKRIRNSAKITQFADLAESSLIEDDDSAAARITAVLHKIQEVASLEPFFKEKSHQLNEAKSLIEDVVYEIRNHLRKTDISEDKMEELESQLSDLRKLQKKYGQSVAEILEYKNKIAQELQQLHNSENTVEQRKKEIAEIEKELQQMAVKLHKKRSETASLLADSVNGELLDLNMKGVTFHVSVLKEKELGPNGFSDVEFMSQTSPADPPRPLAKFASGGELSRILLSLKRVVGSSLQPRTYLFDEVDTGVSGTTAEKVGKKLRSIAKGQQVICVTHLPQVGAYGDAHFFIQKSPVKGSVAMEIKELIKQDRVNEIARLISGEKITKTSLAHAEQLLSEAGA